MKRRGTTVGAALLLSLGIAGCTKTIDGGELEGELKTKLGASDIQSVDCPDDIEAKKGKKFDCTITTKTGQKAKAQITLTNNEGGFTAQLAPGS